MEEIYANIFTKKKSICKHIEHMYERSKYTSVGYWLKE